AECQEITQSADQEVVNLHLLVSGYRCAWRSILQPDQVQVILDRPCPSTAKRVDRGGTEFHRKPCNGRTARRWLNPEFAIGTERPPFRPAAFGGGRPGAARAPKNRHTRQAISIPDLNKSLGRPGCDRVAIRRERQAPNTAAGAQRSRPL